VTKKTYTSHVSNLSIVIFVIFFICLNSSTCWTRYNLKIKLKVKTYHNRIILFKSWMMILLFSLKLANKKKWYFNWVRYAQKQDFRKGSGLLHMNLWWRDYKLVNVTRNSSRNKIAIRFRSLNNWTMIAQKVLWIANFVFVKTSIEG